MKAHTISELVHCLHADIKTTDLFEGIWPIPQGVSLNAYLVRGGPGGKTALIDLFKDWSGAAGQFEEALASVGSGFDQVDYLILNHLEPDHTGWLGEFRRRNPRAKIISTAKGINLIKTFYKEDDGLRAVKDGDKLDLGGLELTFFETPNIHWPETMVTWEPSSGTLFSCDAFGSFGALGDRVFDDEFSGAEHALFEKECLRYYANIISSFSTFVERGMAKLSGLDIRRVAPSHGMVWRKNPKTIMDRYRTYASYSRPALEGAEPSGEREIAVIWGSMYGNTRRGLDAVIRGIEAGGAPYSVHQVPNEDVSYVLADAFKSRGLVLAMPTYEYAMFPPMAYVLDIFRRKHIFHKTALRVGSWGWVGGARKEYEAAIEALQWESVPSMEWAGAPTAEECRVLEDRGRELARIVRA
ncbi:MAG: FprA family A-type flavoprotein [Treponema sp.]|jgi:flavorubredoxin|nr:FprA family A-type flavoprotein [Treponema sp.]